MFVFRYAAEKKKKKRNKEAAQHTEIRGKKHERASTTM
jgi:hypothetical protein